MEIQLNDYHKKVNAQMQKSMAYWREHPLSLEECLAQFKRLREQRNVRQTLLAVPQCLSSCQLSKHSERHWIFSYLPCSFLQKLTPKRWLGSQEQVFAYPADWWMEGTAKNRYPTSTPQAILKYPTSSVNMWRLLFYPLTMNIWHLRKLWVQSD